MSEVDPGSIEELAHLVGESKVIYTDIHEAFIWELSSLDDRLNADVECRKLCAAGDNWRPLDLLSQWRLSDLSNKSDSTYLRRWRLDKIIDYQPENQVITVQAGINLLLLNSFLAQHGQTIPLRRGAGFYRVFEPTLPQLYKYIESGTPHNLMAQHGTWRDWILAAKLVMADGTIVSSGAAVVKNVTGFDLHRLIVGSRGTLGLLAEATLKTTPLSSLKEVTIEDATDCAGVWSMHYHRTAPSDWAHLVRWLRDESPSFSLDHASYQAVYAVNDESEVPIYSNQIYQDFDKTDRLKLDATMQRLMKRTKEIFDPTYKLNPGEFGFI